MSENHDSHPLFEGLTPAQQEALKAAFEKDPGLAEAYAYWQQVCTAIRQSVFTHVPDRRLFVLYALDVKGRTDVLSEEERREVAAVRSSLDAAVQAHPALTDVIDQVGLACDDFEEAWNQHFAADAPAVQQQPAHGRAPERRPQPRRVPQATPVRRVVRWGWRVAAVVAVAAFVAVLTFMLQRDQHMTTLTLAEGEAQVVTLADGSTVRLLGGSSLTYVAPESSTPFNRRVVLTGRAFFDIVPDRQGFTVETPTALTTVLGTTFGIQADENAMEVVLATGSISVASKAAQEEVVVLQPGQMSRVVEGTSPTAPAPVDLTEALDWTGLFIFQATPLGEAAARLSEQYGIPITVPAALQDEGVNGTFAREESLARILDLLATTLNATVQGDDAEGYTIGAGE